MSIDTLGIQKQTYSAEQQQYASDLYQLYGLPSPIDNHTTEYPYTGLLTKVFELLREKIALSVVGVVIFMTDHFINEPHFTAPELWLREVFQLKASVYDFKSASVEQAGQAITYIQALQKTYGYSVGLVLFVQSAALSSVTIDIIKTAEES